LNVIGRRPILVRRQNYFSRQDELNLKFVHTNYSVYILRVMYILILVC